MNCKPGDLAIVVRGEPENNGIMLRVHEFDPADCTWTFSDASRPITVFLGSCKDGFASCTADGNAWVLDCELMPIRDNDGEDEMLRIAGLPAHKETERTA